MARALWKGAISFGLVSIPVGLHAAEKSQELSFTMLDRRNLAPVGFRRVNKETGAEVPWAEVVKGYEYAKDRYVVLSDEDFRRANVEATQTVDIVAFVELADIPPLYFETPYYLAPLARGEKGYVLLREALKRSGKVGLATVVIRTRQHLAALLPMGPALAMTTLRYKSELRPASELDLPPEDARINPKELEMALRLLEGMSEPWKPERYHDTYHDDILARVEEKVKAGQTDVIAEREAGEAKSRKGAEVIDLMTLLKRSVQGQGSGRHAGAKQGERPRAARRKAPARSTRAGAHRSAQAERRKHA